MELTGADRGFLEDNIEAERAAYRTYMDQAEQTANPQLARLWQMIAQDERRHAERQRALLTLAGGQDSAPPAAAPVAPGLEWRGVPWPGPLSRGGEPF